MHKKANHTAILIFAQSAKLEALRKPIRNGELVFDALNKQTLSIVQATGLPYLVWDEEKQIGETFAERFSNALQAVFDKGYKNVISIGNDSPNLTVSKLKQAYKQICKGKTVLGPSADGGVYLIGIHKDHFRYNDFKRLPWERISLFKRISESFGLAGEIHQLETLTDVDSETDILEILQKPITQSLKRALVLGLSRQAAPKTYTHLSYITHYLSTFYNKGSPQFN
ncbi:hypothetical protein BUL40_01365 [Croceivirga radicis]|uniref:Glycosyltransferase n=1 Tax=Croceivirga radicis TaxID=1929488 RepID=A0A1V6LVU5_9FLAO|nr:DUF2064 domain-containing protein [Croceivirga radicis]OQD44235.1 hypothetical protein BUL40_01365 [Croceivirga radicis]